MSLLIFLILWGIFFIPSLILNVYSLASASKGKNKQNILTLSLISISFLVIGILLFVLMWFVYFSFGFYFINTIILLISLVLSIIAACFVSTASNENKQSKSFFVQHNQNNDYSYINELKELKILLDNGVITQEEFNFKKEQILRRIYKWGQQQKFLLLLEWLSYFG